MNAVALENILKTVYPLYCLRDQESKEPEQHNTSVHTTMTFPPVATNRSIIHIVSTFSIHNANYSIQEEKLSMPVPNR